MKTSDVTGVHFLCVEGGVGGGGTSCGSCGAAMMDERGKEGGGGREREVRYYAGSENEDGDRVKSGCQKFKVEGGAKGTGRSVCGHERKFGNSAVGSGEQSMSGVHTQPTHSPHTTCAS